MYTTPYEIVSLKYQLPYPFYEPQVAVTNAIAPLLRGSYYCKVGTGKTGMMTVDALYQRELEMADQHIVMVPPILQTSWMRWLAKIPGVTATQYAGTPKERSLIKLDGMFIVMSYHIFKRDFEYLYEHYRYRQPGVIFDEASALKNIASGNFRYVRDFTYGKVLGMDTLKPILEFAGKERSLRMATGTPTATPEDCYSYISLINPYAYKSKQIFDSLHLGKRDQYGRVLDFQNLELLKTNFAVGAAFLTRRELPGYLEPKYTPIPYQLHPTHYELYRKLCDEGVLELETGGKIDATSISKLWTSMQQIVMNWDHFSGDPKKRSAGHDLCEEIAVEVVEREKAKLIIVANYQMTMRGLMRHLARFNPRLINGTLTTKQQELAKEQFITDPTVGILLLQPQSGGYGLDGIQEVCKDSLVIEEPLSPIPFEQTLGRIDRTGQMYNCHHRIAYAEGTIQYRLHKNVLSKDEMSTYVQGGWRSIKEALYGK